MPSDRPGDGLTRRNLMFGSLATLGVVGGFATIGVVTDDRSESVGPVPSSELVSAEASVYDERAGMCGIDLVVDVAESEHVVIQNDMDGGTDRTVQNSGERLLRTVVPSDSSVLIYAVDLDANTSKTLARYRVSEECTLSEVDA